MTHFPELDPDAPLTPEQETQARLLTASDLQHIDECLLSQATHQWHKVARIIGLTMKILNHEFPDLPDAFYSLRIQHLVECGAIEAIGNLNRMRYSEVRIPGANPKLL